MALDALESLLYQKGDKARTCMMQSINACGEYCMEPAAIIDHRRLTLLMNIHWRKIAERSITSPQYSYKRRRLSLDTYDIPKFVPNTDEFWFEPPPVEVDSGPEDERLVLEFEKLYVFP